MKSLVAAAALALLSTTAHGASCAGTLTNSCIVIDSDGDFATEGNPNPAVNLSNTTDLGINETFLFFSEAIGNFTTVGDFVVAPDFKNPAVARVTISEGAAGEFTALNLAFNADPAQSILAAGTYFFTLLAGANNAFTVTGTANPVFAGPVSYNIALSAIPIPAALPLFGTALAGMYWLSRRRRAA